MYWATGVGLLQNALMLAVWLSLPLLSAIVIAGLVGAWAQGLFGLNDPAGLLAPKLVAAGAILVLFGAWMLSLTCSYWGPLWAGAASLVNAR